MGVGKDGRAMMTLEEGYELLCQSRRKTGEYKRVFLLDAICECVCEVYHDDVNGYTQRKEIRSQYPALYTTLKAIDSLEKFAALIARIKLERSAACRRE